MNNTNLTDKRSIAQVLGCMIKEPELLEEASIEMGREDFPERFHLILFATLQNLYEGGMRKVDSVAFDSYLGNYPKQHIIFEKNNGMDYVDRIVESAELDNFMYHANRVKKFTLLRAYEEKGISTLEIYNENLESPSDLEEMRGRFDRMTLKDISDHFSLKQIEIEDNYLMEEGTQELHASEGLYDLKEKLKLEPEYGSALGGSILTTVLRGARLKKIYMRSAPSGVGKCVVGDSIIYTENGMELIGEIDQDNKIGLNNSLNTTLQSYDLDHRVAVRGSTTNWYNMGRQDTIKITSALGYEIEGTPEHPIIVKQSNGETVFKELQDIDKSDKVAINRKNRVFGQQTLPSHISYLLGALYPNIFKRDGELFYFLEGERQAMLVNELVYDNIAGGDHLTSSHSEEDSLTVTTIRNEEAIRELEEYGLAQESLPKAIRLLDRQSKISVLQGLIETNGRVIDEGISLTFGGKERARQTQMLLLNFGIMASLDERTLKIEDYESLVTILEEVPLSWRNPLKRKLSSLVADKILLNELGEVGLTNPEDLITLDYFLEGNLENYKEQKRIIDYLREEGAVPRTVVLDFFEKVDPVLWTKRVNLLINEIEGLVFLDIDKIEKSENIVYDFTVKNTHSFMSNGFISHNTRLSIGDCMHIGASHMYDWKLKEWKYLGVPEPTLFITTELEEEEVQTMMMAFISGINEEKILNGDYTREEEVILDQAIKIIENDMIRIAYMPDFSIDDIERTIKRHKIKYGIKHIFFDYIHISMELLREMSEASSGMRMREDNVLLMFVNKIKQLCNDLGVFVFTATQVNDGYQHNDVINESVLRGAKSMADKIKLSQYIAICIW